LASSARSCHAAAQSTTIVELMSDIGRIDGYIVAIVVEFEGVTEVHVEGKRKIKQFTQTIDVDDRCKSDFGASSSWSL
jgi:hypothetical protein